MSVRTQQRTIQEIQAAELEKELQKKRIKAERLVSQYNKDPRSISDEQMQEVKDIADVMSYSIGLGQERDKLDMSRGDDQFAAGKAALGGVADSALLGLLRNDWYTDRRTENVGKYGRLAGDLGMLAMTLGSSSAGYLGKGGVKAAKGIRGMTTAGKIAKATDSAADAASVLSRAKELTNKLDTAYDSLKMVKPSAAINIGKRANQSAVKTLAGQTDNIFSKGARMFKSSTPIADDLDPVLNLLKGATPKRGIYGGLADDAIKGVDDLFDITKVAGKSNKESARVLNKIKKMKPKKGSYRKMTNEVNRKRRADANLDEILSSFYPKEAAWQPRPALRNALKGNTSLGKINIADDIAIAKNSRPPLGKVNVIDDVSSRLRYQAPAATKLPPIEPYKYAGQSSMSPPIAKAEALIAKVKPTKANIIIPKNNTTLNVKELAAKHKQIREISTLEKEIGALGDLSQVADSRTRALAFIEELKAKKESNRLFRKFIGKGGDGTKVGNLVDKATSGTMKTKEYIKMLDEFVNLKRAYALSIKATALVSAYKTTYNDFGRRTEEGIMSGELPPLPQQPQQQQY